MRRNWVSGNWVRRLPAAVAGLGLLVGVGQAAAKVQVGGYAYQGSCPGNPPWTAEDVLYVEDSGGAYPGAPGTWWATSTPTFAEGSASAVVYWTGNCAQAIAGASTSDLIFSSVGGAETTIHVRMHVTITSDWVGNNITPVGGANVGWNIHQAYSFGPAIPGAPGSGSVSTCYTSPWVTAAVDSPSGLAYAVAGWAGGGESGGIGRWTDDYVTLTPGCTGLPFLEIQEAGFTYDSAELGIANGAFVGEAPVPALGSFSIAVLLAAVVGVGAPFLARRE